MSDLYDEAAFQESDEDFDKDLEEFEFYGDDDFLEYESYEDDPFYTDDDW